jgi:hypothetical protein
MTDSLGFGAENVFINVGNSADASMYDQLHAYTSRHEDIYNVICDVMYGVILDDKFKSYPEAETFTSAKPDESALNLTTLYKKHIRKLQNNLIWDIQDKYMENMSITSAIEDPLQSSLIYKIISDANKQRLYKFMNYVIASKIQSEIYPLNFVQTFATILYENIVKYILSKHVLSTNATNDMKEFVISQLQTSKNYIKQNINLITKPSQQQGGNANILGQGGFGRVYAFDTHNDFTKFAQMHMQNVKRDNFKKIYIVIHEFDKCTIVPYISNAPIVDVQQIVVKEFIGQIDKKTPFLEINEELTNNTIVYNAIQNINKQEPLLQTIVKLDYHIKKDDQMIKFTLDSYKKHIVDKYTPLHTSLKSIEFIIASTSLDGRLLNTPISHNDYKRINKTVYKKFIIFRKRDGDLYRKISTLKRSLNDQDIEKCIKACFITLVILHSIGYYHLDIKPANILYANQDVYNLADYGLLNTRYGGGTPGYMFIEYYINPTIFKSYKYNYIKYFAYSKTNVNLFIMTMNHVKANLKTLDEHEKIKHLSIYHDIFALGLTLHEVYDGRNNAINRFIQSMINLTFKMIPTYIANDADQRVRMKPYVLHVNNKLINDLISNSKLPQKSPQVIMPPHAPEKLVNVVLPKSPQIPKPAPEKLVNVVLPKSPQKPPQVVTPQEYDENTVNIMSKREDMFTETDIRKLINDIKSSNVCGKSYNMSALENGVVQYDLIYNFFSLLNVMSKSPNARPNAQTRDAPKWPKLQGGQNLSERFKNIFQDKNVNISNKVAGEICIFTDLCDVFLKMTNDIKKLKNNLARYHEKTVLLQKTQGFDYTTDEIYIPQLRYIATKQSQQTLNTFKNNIVVFGENIINQIENADFAVLNQTPLPREKWIHDLYFTSSSATDEEITTVFSSSFISTFIKKYNSMIFPDTPDVFTIDVTQLHPLSQTIKNVLIKNIYFKTYKLIQAETLRRYMQFLIIYKCSHMGGKCMESKELQEFMSDFNITLSSKLIPSKLEHLLKSYINDLIQVHNNFVLLLNNDSNIVVNFQSKFNDSEETIKRIINGYNNPIILKYASISKKIIECFQKNNNDAFGKKVCDNIDKLPGITKIPEIENINKTHTDIMKNIFISPLKACKHQLLSYKVSRAFDESVQKVQKHTDCASDIEYFIRFIKTFHMDDVFSNIVVNDIFSKYENAITDFATCLHQNKVNLSQVRINDTTNYNKFIDDKKNYIDILNFYENLSGAVRVFVKVRDDYLFKPTDTPEKYWNEQASSWDFKGQGLFSLSDSFVKIQNTNGQVVRYGPFFTVIPPYVKTNNTYQRINNKIVAENYLHVDEMSLLLKYNKNTNLVLFTYGYSGSGKTYTLFDRLDDSSTGTNAAKDVDAELRRGSVFRFLESILENDSKTNDVPLVQLVDIKLLYGKFAVKDEKQPLIVENVQDFFSVSKYATQRNEINDIFKQIKQQKSKKQDDLRNKIKQLLFDIIEKNNTQRVYDSIVKLLTSLEKGTINTQQFEKEINNIMQYYNVFTGNKDVWVTKMKKNKLAAKDEIYNYLFSQTKPSELYIKSTPNNPSSSRGFLFFTFSITQNNNTNNIMIVDMAGNEDPYDILMKTIPTYKLPHGTSFTFLKNNDVSDNDIILETTKNIIKQKIETVLVKICNPISTLLIAKNDSTRLSALQECNVKTILNTINNNINVDPTNTESLRQQFKFNSNNFMYNFFMNNKNFATILNNLNYNIYEFVISLYSSIITSSNALHIVNPSSGELNTYIDKTFKISDKNVRHIDTIIETYCTKYKKDIKNSLNVLHDRLLMSVDVVSKDLKINLRLNDVIMSVITIQSLCTLPLFDDKTSKYISSLGDQNNVFTSGDFKLLNGLTSNDKITHFHIINSIEKINNTIDILYFNKFKSSASPDYSIIKIIENLSYIKYILSNILSNKIFIDNFKVEEALTIMEKTEVIKISTDKSLISTPIKINSVPVDKTKLTTTIQKMIKFNDIFDSLKVAVVKLEEGHETEKNIDDKYSIIEANTDYYKTIINEGFYINQVNYELINYLKKRMNPLSPSPQTGGYKKKKKQRGGSMSSYEIPIYDEHLSRMVVEKYQPNENIFGNVQEPKTQIVNVLKSMIPSVDDARFFMIANIRPDLRKFRQGAINTLELVKELASS